MSRVRKRRLNDTVTVWRESSQDDGNPYASQSWDRLGDYPCNYMDGGQVQRDDQGSDFQPAKTIRIESTDIKNGDRVAIGFHSNQSPVSGSETIKKVASKTAFRGSSDMTLYTG